MARYIPPARRQSRAEQVEEVKPKLEDGLVSLDEIDNYFWPVTGDRLPQASTRASGRTLHDSSKTPGKLSWLVLFNGANPRWNTDRIIFTKSSLELLPPGSADDQSKKPSGHSKTSCKPSADEEEAARADKTESKADIEEQQLIAVFKQVSCHQTGRIYVFEGWFRIERLAFLEPKSAELVRMLEQKWTRVDARGNVRQERRDQARWNESLNQRWAVVKLAKDEAAERERGRPNIERLEDKQEESGPKKSVNEMLAELRMRDGEAATEPAADASAT